MISNFTFTVYKWFGKTIMVLDGASQHRAKIIREALKEMNGEVRLVFLPPGCPDLNAIEEIWRQMKHAVLDAPDSQTPQDVRGHRQVARGVAAQTGN